MDQLTQKTGIKPVYYNSPKDTSCSHKVEQKELHLRQVMDIVSINSLINPKKTKGLGNSPVSVFNKLQTEFEVQKDKNTCSSITDYEKKNARYKFNHGINMPVKRVSATSGIGRPDNKTLETARIKAEKYRQGQVYTQIEIRDPTDEKNMKVVIDDRMKHELK